MKLNLPVEPTWPLLPATAEEAASLLDQFADLTWSARGRSWLASEKRKAEALVRDLTRLVAEDAKQCGQTKPAAELTFARLRAEVWRRIAHEAAGQLLGDAEEGITP